MTTTRGDPAALAGLVTGAFVWGLVWYPYRVMAEQGLAGVPATTLTYLVALALALPLVRARRPGFSQLALLALIGLSAAGCNLGYVLATLEGEVMRVLLLFYLAPLWTVVLARVILGERIGPIGGAVILLALAGAAVMLWRPDLGAPLPSARAEWIGLAAGFLFALSNVLSRKARHVSIEARTVAVFAGVVILGSLIWMGGASGAATQVRGQAWLLAALVGVVLLAVNLVVQHGLTHTPAARAIIIFLLELVVAALASWWLAGESLSSSEWIGAAMIVGASLFSSRLAAGHDER